MKKSNHRTLFNSLISLFIIIGVVVLTQISMPNPNQFCIQPEPDATWTFGRHVAMNDKYLVLSDSLRNKVIVYTPDESGEWGKAKEILPPANLDLSQEIGSGSAFGSGLELDGDVLTISAMTKNPEWLKRDFSQSLRDGIPQYVYWRYLTNLKKQTPLKPIDLLVEPEPELDRVRFNLLRQGKIEQFILPNMGEKILGSNEGRLSSSVALDGNLLLVGYASNYTGGAFLFDLARPEAEPLNLAVEDTALGNRVAVSQQFAAVGFDGHYWYFPQGNARDRSHKTLIRNLENGASTIIRSFGQVSLSGNILAVMNPGSGDTESQFIEVFRLDENAQAHLITKRTVFIGEVQNGFLFTKKFNDSNKVCIEPLPQN